MGVEDGGDGKQQIQIKVRDQQGQETIFKVKKETAFSKIFAAYAAQKGIAANSFRLMFDGKRVDQHDTPKTLEMEDDDMVDAIVEQIGGADEDGGEKKPVPETITIKVRDGNGNDTAFKVKKETKFEKIIGAYAQQKGIAADSFHLLFDGVRIKGTDTPKMLEMEEEDQLQAVMTQTGGGRASCC